MKKKRLLLSSLAAALLITSAIGFNSCKKTTTENDSEDAEWAPTTYTFISDGEGSSTRLDGSLCPYCSEPLNVCAHGWNWTYYTPRCPAGAYDPIDNPLGHYHIHDFDATGPNSDCRPPEEDVPEYFCKYKGVRAHRHVVVHWENGFLNYWHTGGGGDGGAVIP